MNGGMRYVWLLSALIGFAVFARGAEPSAYGPLAEGMEWTMDAKVTTPEGQVIDTTAHRTVGASEQRDGKTYFRMRTSMEGIPQLKPYETLLRRDETGLYAIDLRDPGLKEALSIAFPLEVGRKWIRDNGKMVVTMEVLAREDLTIHGTTYKDCYKIQAAAKDGSYSEVMWQAPGLGSIKSDVVLSVGAKVSISLREFKPGKVAK